MKLEHGFMFEAGGLMIENSSDVAVGVNNPDGIALTVVNVPG